MTGDGELQEGQNWEALPSAARYGMGELTVVVDHNGLQSDTFVTDVSDLGDLAGKFTAMRLGRAALRRAHPQAAGAGLRPPRRGAPGPARGDHRGHGEGRRLPDVRRHIDGTRRMALPPPQRGAEPAGPRLRPPGAARHRRRDTPRARPAAAPAGREHRGPAGETFRGTASRAVRPAAHRGGARGPADRRARRRPGAGHGPDPVPRGPPGPVRRMRHRRAGHGLDGGRTGRGRSAAVRALVLLLPARAAQRAHLQQRHRRAAGGLRRLARRAAAHAAPATRTRRSATCRR